MIAPQELKQNNLIRDIESGRIGAVLTIGEKKCTIKMPFSKLSQSYEEFEPIELNEHWLLKFGYEPTTPGYWSNGKLEIGYTTTDDNIQYEYISITHKTEMTDLKYVHQFQNLTFSLTGEELKIKKNETA